VRSKGLFQAATKDKWINRFDFERYCPDFAGRHLNFTTVPGSQKSNKAFAQRLILQAVTLHAMAKITFGAFLTRSFAKP